MSNYLRMVVCWCPVCNKETERICREQEAVLCQWCGMEMEQHWWKRSARQSVQWSDADAVVVFRKPDGSYSFPAINTKQCPEGWEKIVARSDREVAAIERASNTLNESRWFDRGSGRGFDTGPLRGQK